jgi:hypothetical protein
MVLFNKKRFRMKAILKFNLPEEQKEFNGAIKSLDMACALFDILQLRNILEQRYWEDDTVTDVYTGIDAMAKGIVEILEKHNINIDRIIE